ncbi:MAG: DUF1015 domain-containing protein [Bacteroidetes bacterium]|nr:DUF1015 domain-containing protein [Bacteroidota bacterium]
MITIKPFKAIRPPRDKAYLVATRSYLSYNEEELDDKLRNNPYSFMHVINPKEGRKMPFGKEKYQIVRDGFKLWLEEGIFIQDSEPSYYLYSQVKDGNEYIGIIAGVSVNDYQEGRIKKHENTLSAREEMFTDYLEETGFNAEPVLLIYHDEFSLNQLFARYIETRAEYEFTSTDKVYHQLWPISEAKDLKLITDVFAQQEQLYIADGHHRSASSAKLKDRMAQAGQESGAHNYFMAFLIGEEQMKIYDFNRLVINNTGKKKEAIFKELERCFHIEPKHEETFHPQKIHEMGMYFEKEWYKLSPKMGSFDPGDAVGHLDAEILSRNILGPIFNILDLKSDNRVDFVPGTNGLEYLEQAVDQGKYQLAFSLFPVSIEQIKQVSDAGKSMPPKSTYIEPKLRSGLTIYPIQDH